MIVLGGIILFQYVFFCPLSVSQPKLSLSMHPTFSEIRPKTWDKAIECLNVLDQFCAFRGQSDAAWDLRTSIERCNFFGKNYRVEKDFLKDFQRGAYSHISLLPEPRDVLSWLTLMQHHGAPTRLLDFTHSPYIASYFALENAETDSAVWAVHKLHLLNNLAKTSPNFFQYRGDEHYGLPDESFNEIFEQNKLSCVFPVQPSVSNKRYMAQQSIFLSMGNSNETFMKQLQSYLWPEYLSQHVVKVILPAKIRNEALFDLSRMNINRATLFPDIDGFSVFLKNLYELKYDGAASKFQHRKKKRAIKEIQ